MKMKNIALATNRNKIGWNTQITKTKTKNLNLSNNNNNNKLNY